MNIGMLCYPSIGGSGVIAAQLGKNLAARGHTIHYITYDKPFRLIESENIYFHKVTTSDYELFKYTPYEFALVNKIVKVATEYDLDIIHVHYAIPHVICAYLAKQMLIGTKDITIITTLHGTDVTIMGYDKSMKNLLAFGLHESSAITAVSNSLANEAADVFGIDRNIHTIYNFIDANEFSPERSNQSLRDTFARPEEKLVIHVSNLRSVKRPFDLIKTFALIKERIPCKLLIVGEEANGEKLRDSMHNYNVGNDVILLNQEYEVSTLLASSDLFLLPSEKESFGLAALEAMASGLPVVATRTGGIPELVSEGETGFLSAVGDIEGLANSSIEILTNESLHRIFSANARNRALKVFNEDHIVAEYEQVYRNSMIKCLIKE